MVFNLVPNKVVSMKGEKTVIVKTMGQEKVHCTVLLGILPNGNKLPPLIVFKGNKNGKLSASYSNDNNLKNNKVLICFNENAWVTGDIMLHWIKNIWKIYLDENSEGFPSLLFMDHASMQVKENIIEEFEKFDTIVSFIPKSLTFCLQPLDVMINRLLKDELRKKYVSFCTNKKNDNKVTRDMVIDWIQDIWYNSKAINKDLIYKSFRTCVLTNKLDGRRIIYSKVLIYCSKK